MLFFFFRYGQPVPLDYTTSHDEEKQWSFCLRLVAQTDFNSGQKQGVKVADELLDGHSEEGGEDRRREQPGDLIEVPEGAGAELGEEDD